jgi:hypothetical protein
MRLTILGIEPKIDGKTISERLRAASCERIKRGHFEVKQLISHRPIAEFSTKIVWRVWFGNIPSF